MRRGRLESQLGLGPGAFERRFRGIRSIARDRKTLRRRVNDLVHREAEVDSLDCDVAW